MSALSILWTHVRNMLVIGYKNKTVYQLPIMFGYEMTQVIESAVIKDGHIVVTMKSKDTIENETETASRD